MKAAQAEATAPYGLDRFGEWRIDPDGRGTWEISDTSRVIARGVISAEHADIMGAGLMMAKANRTLEARVRELEAACGAVWAAHSEPYDDRTILCQRINAAVDLCRAALNPST